MKIGSIVKVKSDIIGSKNEFVGLKGRVIGIEPRCEGEYATVLLDSRFCGHNAYDSARVFCFSISELEEKV